MLFLTLRPEDSGKHIALRFEVQRLEKAVYRDDGSALAGAGAAPPDAFLGPERFVPADDEFRAIADEVLAGKTGGKSGTGVGAGDLVRARALYDHTIDRMRYMKFGPGFGNGDAVYACDSATGNCTDFHAYFIALARAAGIPARFAIGAAIPSERNDGGIDGYHCWAEFYAEGM